MKTMNELKVKLHKATTLSEKIAIRIEMIELNRLTRNPDNSVISPITEFLNNIYTNRPFLHEGAFVLD